MGCYSFGVFENYVNGKIGFNNVYPNKKIGKPKGGISHGLKEVRVALTYGFEGALRKLCNFTMVNKK